MVASHYRCENEAVLNTFKKTVRDHKIVDTPTDVLCASGEHIAPPGIFDLVGIERAEGVGESSLEKLGKFAAFFIGKSCALTV